MRPLLPFGAPKVPGVRLVLRSLSLGLSACSDGGLHGVPRTHAGSQRERQAAKVIAIGMRSIS